MRLSRVEIQDFRCLEQVVLEPGPKINIISGDNASGKTSLLEAMFMLGRGQTFRGTALGPLVRHGQSSLSLAGFLQDESQRTRRIRVIRQSGRLQYRLDNEPNTKRFDLVSALPLQLIDPNLHRLLEQGPRFRRRFLDWGVFHVEQHFFQAWRTFRRALRQRNSALRRHAAAAAVTAWDEELVKASLVVDACRRRYVSRLAKLLPDSLVAMLGQDIPAIEYFPGWNRKQDVREALATSLERDRRAGYTHVGPHRADLRLTVGGTRAHAHVSRGQQKLLAVALLLAQVRLLMSETSVRPLLLVDDVAAELGADYLGAIFRELEQLGVQCFVTALDARLLPQSSERALMFHVEHGQVTAL